MTNFSVVTLGILFAAVLLPLGLQLYLSRLPVAPACPSCRSTTRPSEACGLEAWLPALVSTSVGECARCGWRGRMRWRWAVKRQVRR